ncbi:MAG: protein translocase subunit SecF [Thermoleophilia bacterium]
MRYKMWFVAALGLITLFAFASVLLVGLDLGIEFRGGARVEVILEREATTSVVREAFVDAGVPSPQVQTVGEASYVVTAEEITEEELDAALGSLSADYGAERAASGIERVGPSFGEETANKALIAILAAIVAIIIYITWRFEFKYALPAIAALVHDVGLTLGVYAVTDRLVTTATVAAVLTVVGYSINDTIIVFDRIRENTPLMRKESYAAMVDRSIRQVFVRSINTSLSTLLPVGAILLFGGATLKDFAFALFIGIAAGTYSSIFVASPLLVLWKEREPRYRKRALADQA